MLEQRAFLPHELSSHQSPIKPQSYLERPGILIPAHNLGASTGTVSYSGAYIPHSPQACSSPDCENSVEIISQILSQATALYSARNTPIQMPCGLYPVESLKKIGQFNLYLCREFPGSPEVFFLVPIHSPSAIPAQSRLPTQARTASRPQNRFYLLSITV